VSKSGVPVERADLRLDLRIDFHFTATTYILASGSSVFIVTTKPSSSVSPTGGVPVKAFQLEGFLDLDFNYTETTIPTGQVDPATADGYAIPSGFPFEMQVSLTNNDSEAISGGVINFYQMTYDDYDTLGSITSPDDLDPFKISPADLINVTTGSNYAADATLLTNATGQLTVAFRYDQAVDDLAEILLAMWTDGVFLNENETLEVVYDYTGVYVSSSKSLSVDSTLSNGSYSVPTYYLILDDTYTLDVDGTLLSFTELPVILNEPMVNQNLTLYLIKLSFYNDIIAAGGTQELQYTYFSSQEGSRTSERFYLAYGITDSSGAVNISAIINSSNSASGTWYIALVLDGLLIAFEPTKNIVIYSWSLPLSPIQPLTTQTTDLFVFKADSVQLPVNLKSDFERFYVTDNELTLKTIKPQLFAKKLLSEVST